MSCLIGPSFECLCTVPVDIFWNEFVRFYCNQKLKTFQHQIQSKIIFGCARTKTMKGIWYIFLCTFSCTNQKHISHHAYSEVRPCVLQSTKDYSLFPTYETNPFYLSIPSWLHHPSLSREQWHPIHSTHHDRHPLIRPVISSQTTHPALSLAYTTFHTYRAN